LKLFQFYFCLLTKFNLFRKEKDLLAMADKIENEQAEVVKGQKQIKEMAVRTLLQIIKKRFLMMPF